LITAAFLFFSGVTGAVISWDHELDDLLNRRLFDVTTEGPARSSTDLAKLIEQRDPRGRVVYLLTTPEPKESLSFFVLPRIDPITGKRFVLETIRSFSIPTPARNWAGATGALSGRSHGRTSSRSFTGYTTQCTCRRCGGATGGECVSLA
jgi:hypothetical protein